MSDRLATMACTTSIGPGATNLVTGAALATVNRLPVLLLPGDVFATRVANPVLQELEDPRSYDISVNDALRPVSRYWDRIYRPEQLPSALLAAMRVLTDPADTGAVTLALPQDVQAEAYDGPRICSTSGSGTFADPCRAAALERAAAAGAVRPPAAGRRGRRRRLLAGHGGAARVRRGDRRAGGGDPGGQGNPAVRPPAGRRRRRVTGTTAANTLARRADVVIGVGTRYSDFTTASRTFADPDVRFVNLNVAHAGCREAGRHRARRRRGRVWMR